MSLKNEKYKNKLENGRKKKFGKEFAEIPPEEQPNNLTSTSGECM